MSEPNCRTCGEPCPPPTSGRYTQRTYCSTLCQDRRPRVRRRAEYQATLRKTIRCIVCDREHAIGKYHSQTSCSVSCGFAALLIGKSSPWPRSPIASPLAIRICPWCERTFVKRTGHTDGTYCDVSHRHAHAATVPLVTDLAYRNCRRCGSLFVRRAIHIGDYCGTRCRDKTYNRRREVRKRTQSTGPTFTIRDVAQRDNWTCHICHRTVKDVPYTGLPTDATIDHLIPVSCGGEDDLDNVALAHMICNTRRGVGGFAQLLLL